MCVCEHAGLCMQGCACSVCPRPAAGERAPRGLRGQRRSQPPRCRSPGVCLQSIFMCFCHRGGSFHSDQPGRRLNDRRLVARLLWGGGRDGFQPPGPLPLRGFWGDPAPGGGLARLGAVVLPWVGTRQRRWVPGASRCQQRAVASGDPPPQTHTHRSAHTRPAGLDGHPPHRVCAVGDPGVRRGHPGTGSSRVAGGSWGPAEPQCRGKRQDGREPAGLSRQGGTRAAGWATKTFLIFLHIEQQEIGSSLHRTPAMLRAPRCCAWRYSLGFTSRLAPRGNSRLCWQPGTRAGAVLPAGQAGAAHRSGVSEPRVAGAAFCSLPLAQTPSPRLTALLCVCVFCFVLLFLKVHKLVIFLCGLWGANHFEGAPFSLKQEVNKL